MDKQEPKKLPDEEIDKRRRRLTIGVVVAPVILSTLRSKNALAAAPYNCTISGNLSGNTSSHGTPVDCNTLGLSPGYWASPTAIGPPCLWPQIYTPDMLFKDVFTAWPSAFDSLGWSKDTTTLKMAVDASQQSGAAGDTASFTRSAVASLLNAAHFPDYPLNADQVKQLYDATVVNDGTGTILLSDFFNVSGGTIWNMQDVMNYFKSLYS